MTQGLANREYQALAEVDSEAVLSHYLYSSANMLKRVLTALVV